MMRGVLLPAVRSLVVAALVVVLAVPAACSRAAPPTGSLAQRADLRGASYVVAGGPTTELRLLCQITIAAVETAGATAVDECGKVGAVDVRRPADLTDVDTGWAALHGTAHLDGATAPEPLAALRAADAPRGVSWLDPTAAGDTDVVVTRPGSPGIADLALTSAGVPTTLCAPPGDVPGTPGVAAVAAGYGFAPTTRVVLADTGAVLVGVASGRCTAGVVPGSSGRIPALGLVVLPDPRGVLAAGPAGPGGWAPLMRSPVLAGHPGVADVLGEITRRLDGDAMRGMVREVVVDGRDPRDVGRRWLLAQGLIGKN